MRYIVLRAWDFALRVEHHGSFRLQGVGLTCWIYYVCLGVAHQMNAGTFSAYSVSCKAVFCCL